MNLIKQEYVDIDINDLLRYVEEKSNNLRCYSCDNDTWDIHIDLKNVKTLPSVPSFERDGTGIADSYFEVIPFVCRNCGFISFLKAQKFKIWLDENAKDG